MSRNTPLPYQRLFQSLPSCFERRPRPFAAEVFYLPAALLLTSPRRRVHDELRRSGFPFNVHLWFPIDPVYPVENEQSHSSYGRVSRLLASKLARGHRPICRKISGFENTNYGLRGLPKHDQSTIPRTERRTLRSGRNWVIWPPPPIAF